MITLAVFAVLVMLVGPNLSTWIANARVRSVAESMQNSLRMAQAEAIRRNRQTVFALTNATPALAATPVANGTNWYIQTLLLSTAGETAGTYIEGTGLASEQGVTITGPALTCFNSLGRQVANTSTSLGANCTTANPATYDVARTGSDRRLRVQVYLGGQIRMCDREKTLSATNPDGC
jgi:type IV fimbrial biogenesis protein FimT